MHMACTRSTDSPQLQTWKDRWNCCARKPRRRPATHERRLATHEFEGVIKLWEEWRAIPMKTLLLWCVLLVLCWPVAILALILWPLIWLLSIPFRLIGISFDAIFALLRE